MVLYRLWAIILDTFGGLGLCLSPIEETRCSEDSPYTVRIYNVALHL